MYDAEWERNEDPLDLELPERYDPRAAERIRQLDMRGALCRRLK